MKSFQQTFKKILGRYSDFRFDLCDLTADFSHEKITLSGRVLDRKTQREVINALKQLFPDATVNHKAVKILRKAEPSLATVSTNITSVHKSPSFGAEQMDQMVYGTMAEVLHTEDSWAFIRQLDGYLGWTYLPYLHDQPAAIATHIVLAPSVALHDAPEGKADAVTHIMAGTGVRLEAVRNEWGQVTANQIGWLPLDTLRAVDEIPRSKSLRQAILPSDAARMIGIPYLWGGVSGAGIDCSGFSRLLHKWVGLDIPRDADMQARAGKPVELPFQVGDLLFFGEKKKPHNVTHVAISLGGWKVIHSSRRRNGVYYDDVQEVDALRESFLMAATFINQ